MSLIKWHQEIQKEDRERYDNMIEQMLSYDNLDDRMDICDDILYDIQDNYPSFYVYLEDEIKDLTLA
jgi:hypothetical protein